MSPAARLKGRLPARLERCPGCKRHIYPQAKTCPLCGGVLVVLKRKQLKAIARAEAALKALQSLLGA